MLILIYYTILYYAQVTYWDVANDPINNYNYAKCENVLNQVRYIILFKARFL